MCAQPTRTRAPAHSGRKPRPGPVGALHAAPSAARCPLSAKPPHPQDAEAYNILKIKMETEIQTLEQQLEEMRATYQLNQEKLDYNYRVLVERDSENTNTIKQQKKKLTRMADVLSALKAKYAREERRYKQENQDLTEEYKRITEQFKDLQNKFQHFEVADTNRYRDVWQMNEEGITELMRKVRFRQFMGTRVRTLARPHAPRPSLPQPEAPECPSAPQPLRALPRQVLQADKIVHEQQLGLNWFPPSEHIFQAGSQGVGGQRAAQADGEGEGGPISRGQMDNENIKRMLELLCNEAGAMLRPSRGDAVATPPPPPGES